MSSIKDVCLAAGDLGGLTSQWLGVVVGVGFA